MLTKATVVQTNEEIGVSYLEEYAVCLWSRTMYCAKIYLAYPMRHKLPMFFDIKFDQPYLLPVTGFVDTLEVYAGDSGMTLIGKEPRLAWEKGEQAE
jgi:hypothetical protein